MVKRSCKQCGTEFEVPFPSSKRVNCSSRCRGVKTKPRADKGTPKLGWAEATCPCGVRFIVPKSKLREAQRRGRHIMCSPECLDQSRRKGSGRPPSGRKWLNSEGYVVVYVPPEERPDSWIGGQTSDREHRVVMRRILGRDLLPGEHVHHKNGIRTDNRPENLEVWLGARRQPKGVRAADLLEWAREVIALHEEG